MNMGNISVIILLFHTRDNLIENLKQYKDFKVLILDQSNDLELKKKNKKICSKVRILFIIKCKYGFC